MTKEEFEKKYMIEVTVIKTKIENNQIIEEKNYSIIASKDLVTEDLWNEIMYEKKTKDNIREKDVLEFCNRLSKKYGLNPVYKYKEKEQFKIIDSKGNEIKITDVDFKKLEGYRLITSSEYESIMQNKNKGIEGEIELEDEIIYDIDKKLFCFVKSKSTPFLEEGQNYENLGFRIVRTIIEKN
ncbi:hypothetical protein [Fusobacterium pseudoperiodonticum]|uniref:hypothetical protein n=1 Tax=Fusobacterium pseudoperiodonticum TaxID=2663009 RepID=UPI0030D18F6E